jgi:hypothetical protein
MSCMEEMYGPDGDDSCMVVRCEVMYCSDGVESCMVVRCEVVYGTHVWNREYHAWNMWFQCCMKQEVTGNICKRKHRVQQFVIFP